LFWLSLRRFLWSWYMAWMEGVALSLIFSGKRKR